jgi:putative transposase
VDDYESLSHTKWDCKYHLVFIPKYRRKVLYAELRRYLGDVFRSLALQKESRIEEGHLMPDHVHMMISIPPKYAVSQVVGFIKGKSAIHLARTYGERKRNFVGQSFWARGFFVSTVGRDEAVIREYIKNQEPHQPLLAAPYLKAPGSAGGLLLLGGQLPVNACEHAFSCLRRDPIVIVRDTA